MNRSIVVDTTKSAFASLQPVALADVTLADSFWAPRRETNREKTIPQQWRQCEATGRIDNFRRASGHKQDPAFHGAFFNDSDVYKMLEAAAWTLATDQDPKLEKMVDDLIGEIAAAQQPDGYLDTFFMFERAGERLLQRDGTALDAVRQRDHAVILDAAESRFAIGEIACELHFFLPFALAAGLAFFAGVFAILAPFFETAVPASGRVTILPTPALLAQ